MLEPIGRLACRVPLTPFTAHRKLLRTILRSMRKRSTPFRRYPPYPARARPLGTLRQAPHGGMPQCATSYEDRRIP